MVTSKLDSISDRMNVLEKTKGPIKRNRQTSAEFSSAKGDVPKWQPAKKKRQAVCHQT